MNRRFVAAIAAVCIAAALGSAASVAYRVLAGDAAGRKAAKADFDGLRSVLAYVKTTPDLAETSLRTRLATRYEANPRLLLVDVYERGAGDRWRIPADSSYLPGTRSGGSAPEPVYPPFSTILLSSALKGDSSGKLAVDALYISVTQQSVFEAFRDALIGLGAFLSIVALLLAFISGTAGTRLASQERAEPMPATSTPLGTAPVFETADPPVETYDPAAAAEAAAEAAHYQYDTLVSSGPDMEAVTSMDVSVKSAPRPADDGSDIHISPQGHKDRPEGLYSPTSNLGWESYMEERLDAEILRSASFEQDLSLLVVSCDGLSAHDPNYAAIGETIKDFFTFRDLSFERGDDGFSVILPNIDSTNALRMAKEFYKKLVFLAEGDFAELKESPLQIGISSRSGRLVGADRMVEEAAAALEKARGEKDSRIVAFRPDPDKYRHFLAAKGA